MSAPRLTRRLVLEAPARVADGAGGFGAGWTVRGTLWAGMSAGSGRARAGEDVALGTLSWKIVVRAAPAGSPRRPEAGQRFRDGARIFAILAVAEADPGARYLTCFAREEVAR
ncbi:head-tail adaptor protein [Sinirhodobacter huangdaonensis]|uniref:Head-tail adaptor protein n=1 Tax=Paenirhodobacter huangdaonensis TaxID=2501515 RepID=A0A3S3MNQ9_9RHOB|nr:head-tail adaptor protein [Sinirhodobacter huangdaonensis]RWR50039.1 head-tail adaptor protein [Sinirhodobacter huangdaonensis]